MSVINNRVDRRGKPPVHSRGLTPTTAVLPFGAASHKDQS